MYFQIMRLVKLDWRRIRYGSHLWVTRVAPKFSEGATAPYTEDLDHANTSELPGSLVEPKKDCSEGQPSVATRRRAGRTLPTWVLETELDSRFTQLSKFLYC